MVELSIGLSNFDYSIDRGVEEFLRAEPNAVYAPYAAWNFHGRVWFDGQAFQCEVWTYGAPRKVISAETLHDLMFEVSSEFGTE